MNEQNEKWLDEQLKKTIDSGKVEFDSERWKRKYSAEYEALVSRRAKPPNVLRFLWRHQLARVAAVIAVVALVIFSTSRRPAERVVQPIVAKSEQSPAMMMSRLSLTLAYNRGGLDAVDEQCKKAFELLGQKNTTLSIADLLNDKNGQKPERKDL